MSYLLINREYKKAPLTILFYLLLLQNLNQQPCLLQVGMQLTA